MLTNKLQIGRLGEVAVLTEAIRRGYTVSFPWGGNACYDLILEKNGSFVRVQVKTIYWDNSKHRWLVDLTKPHGRKGYSQNEIDLLMCYRDAPYSLLCLPPSVFANRRSITIDDGFALGADW